MPSYRKKPDAVDAIQWSGANTPAIEQFARGGVLDVTDPRIVGGRGLVIRTAGGGVIIATPRDWIVRGAGCELSACSPEAFSASYEPVGDYRITLNGQHLADIVSNSLQYGRR